jgi:hypothetical protein
VSERVVELIAPPRRMFPGAWHTTIKTLADKGAWETAWQRVDALRDAGWRVVEVEVAWRHRPGLEGKRLDWLRSLFGDVPIRETNAQGGRGVTRVRLVRARDD